MMGLGFRVKVWVWGSGLWAEVSGRVWGPFREIVGNVWGSIWGFRNLGLDYR